jgi:hypothetical protein
MGTGHPWVLPAGVRVKASGNARELVHETMSSRIESGNMFSHQKQPIKQAEGVVVLA